MTKYRRTAAVALAAAVALGSASIAVAHAGAPDSHSTTRSGDRTPATKAHPKHADNRHGTKHSTDGSPGEQGRANAIEHINADHGRSQANPRGHAIATAHVGADHPAH